MGSPEAKLLRETNKADTGSDQESLFNDTSTVDSMDSKDYSVMFDMFDELSDPEVLPRDTTQVSTVPRDSEKSAKDALSAAEIKLSSAVKEPAPVKIFDSLSVPLPPREQLADVSMQKTVHISEPAAPIRPLKRTFPFIRSPRLPKFNFVAPGPKYPSQKPAESPTRPVRAASLAILKSRQHVKMPDLPIISVSAPAALRSDSDKDLKTDMEANKRD
ncbi:MAG: hypothetical protein M1825_005827 [Sarcosagium campestre]|nr:MAG: hypothetical protein M1825_005827 [Sarcosagium campestre]